MPTPKFEIEEKGTVYYLAGSDWVRLGQIACVLRDDTVLAREVREWWRARLASDEQVKNFVPPRKDLPRTVAVPLAALGVSAEPDGEFQEAVFTASE